MRCHDLLAFDRCWIATEETALIIIRVCLREYSVGLIRHGLAPKFLAYSLKCHRNLLSFPHQTRQIDSATQQLCDRFGFLLRPTAERTYC